MKKLILNFSVAALATFAAALPAQTRNVVYGRTTISFGSSFQNILDTVGAVTTDLNGNPLQNGSFTLVANAGAVDLTSGQGELSHKNGIIISAAGKVLQLQDFVIDTTNVDAPVVTALFSGNNRIFRRVTLFSVAVPDVSLPLTLQNNVQLQNGVGLTFAPDGQNAVNILFGAPIFQGTVPVGTASVYAVFAPAGSDQ